MPTEQELQQRFDDWMDGMDILLEEFMLNLPSEVSKQLNGSVESLDVLEKWLLGKYPNVETLMTDPDISAFDSSSRYLGQVLIKQLHGKWHIDINGGPPLIANKGVWLSPMLLIRQTVNRRKGNFLSELTKNNIEFHKTDLTN